MQARSGAQKSEQATKLLRDQAREAVAQSRRHFSVEALPVRDRLRQAAMDGDASLEDLTPIERFFVVAASPGAATKVGASVAAQSYCSALKSLPADWWGLPGEIDTAVGWALLAMERAAVPCLVDLLGDKTPLRYLHGESNALARESSYVIADLAAGYLARILRQPFDALAGVAKRQTLRERLRAKAALPQNL